jgi:uncharacterized protein YndB with AHSA1/START domain
MAKTEFVIEPGRQDIVITRTFDAPRDVVFEALTDPAVVAKWWGGPGEVTVDQSEARHGGRWRLVSRDDEGNDWAFRGIYHDVTPSERVIYTFEFEGMPGHVALETVTLEEVDGKTKYVSTSVYSVDRGPRRHGADRDGTRRRGGPGRAGIHRREPLTGPGCALLRRSRPTRDGGGAKLSVRARPGR